MEAQPARTRTSGRPASPQAIRREPVVGIGDAVRTVVPRRAPSPAGVRDVDERDRRAHRRRTRGCRRRGARRQRSRRRQFRRLSSRRWPCRRAPCGPLDAEQGRAQLRQRAPGQGRRRRHVARRLQRAAPRADRLHPPVRARGRPPPATAAGRARTPARWRARRRGAPPAQLGARKPRRRGRGRRTSGRRAPTYQRLRAGNPAARQPRCSSFPKPLALRLEQGATIVYFVVGVDGRVSEGPRVVKSSGFDEFDSAAVRAVRRAAPFPPMPIDVADVDVRHFRQSSDPMTGRGPSNSSSGGATFERRWPGRADA